MWLRKLIGELHRRSVWQVLGSYAVVAWVILQLAETLEGLIGLPLWFGPVIVIVVLLGFPVLLVTTLTQGGWRRGRAGDFPFQDSAEGADETLSSWRPLESNPVKNALRRVFTWRNAILGGVVMLLLLAVGTASYSGLRSAGIGPFGSLLAQGVFESNEELILADFQDMTTDGTLGETVTALFRIDLGQSTSVHLLDRPEIAQVLVRMQKDPTAPVSQDVAMEMAQREGVKAVVTGDVLPLGPGAVVSVRLVASSSGETLVALKETARTVDAVPEAVDRLSAQLRERMGESLRSIQGDPPLQDVTTGSLEALRKYVQAEWALDMGDVATAEALVKEALALDSTFSMAYRKLGVILSNDGREEEAARAAFTKAYEGRERLPDRERLLAEAAYHTYVTEEIDSAVHAYESVLALFPQDRIAENNLAVLHGERDEPDKAADLYVGAIERGGAPAVSYTNAAITLFEMGRADSVAAILAAFQERYPDHPQTLQYSAALASARFDYERAEDLVRELLASHGEDPRWEMWGEAELASYAMIGGRLNEGVERALRAHDLQDETGGQFTDDPRPVFESTLMAALQLHFLEHPEGTVQILDRAWSSPELQALEPEARGHLPFALLYAQAGRPERARELKAAFETEVAQEIREEEDHRFQARAVEAAAALAEGRPEEAVELYREAREAVPRCDLCALPDLGWAFEAAAMPDSAAATYEAYLEEGVLFRSQEDNVNLHRVLLGLGRSYDALGEGEKARELFRRVMKLWAGADPGLGTRVDWLRGRVDVEVEDSF